MIKKIVILGAGNLAWHFVDKISKTDINIMQVFSITHKSAKKLADKYKLPYTDNPEDISADADIYLFMLSDTGLRELSEKFPHKNKTMVHTSGSLPMDIFKNKTNNYGVLYPYQTFRKEIEMDFSKIPMCIEASDSKTEKELSDFAETLNCKYYFFDSEKRKILHIAAVFACNFMNHSIHLGETILKNNNIDEKLLNPLLEQSFKNILNFSAKNTQTGPAVRNDNIIINKHIEILKNNSTLQEVYKILSKSIIEINNNNNENGK